jgi:hypothetical protein
MKRILRKTLKITGISIGVLLVLLFTLPLIFKNKIIALVKKEINKNLEAVVDFKDVDISFFRRFPRVSVRLEDVYVAGKADFAKDTLIAARGIDAAVNLWSFVKGDEMKIYSVDLKSPRIRALVNENGKANWDIVKADTTSKTPDTDTSASSFNLKLNHYSISDGYIYYNDQPGGLSAEITGLNHEGSGDFTQDMFTLSTDTKADAISLTSGGVPYLVQTRTVIDADVAIDNKNSKYTFKTDDIELNNLKLSAGGFFQLINDSTYGMDITFKTPSNDFKDILSLIPAIYKTDFDKLKTEGKAAFEGFVKGTYSPQQMPAYDVKLQVDNGFFQYPDLPKPVRNIQINLQASNPDGQPDNMVINLSKGHLEMDKEPFDFKFLFRQPETQQYIDAVAKGKLDLAQVSQFVKLDDMKLAGLVWADIFAKGSLKSLQQQQGDFAAGGFLDVRNLFYSSAAFPAPIQNGNMKIDITNTGGVADNTTVSIPSGHVEVGKDPVDFSLQVSKPMSVLNFSGQAKGSFVLDHVKQFVTLEPGTSLSGLLQADVKFAGNKAAIDRGAYDQINLGGTANVSNLKYAAPDYPGGVQVPVLNATFNPHTVSINQFNGSYLQSNFNGSGTVENPIGYALRDEPLKGSLSVAVDKMNLNKWMGTSEAATPAKDEKSQPAASSSDPFLVPSNLNLTLNAKAGEVIYDKVTYRNISGTVALADQTVRLQNLQANALEGNIIINGSYSTKVDKKEPDVTLNYDVKDVDIQKAFLAFNTVQKLMPIAQFIDGKLNSQLTIRGNLEGNMMPDLASLTGNGNLLLLDGVLRKFAPLEKLASTLQIDELKSITVKDIKNYIEFANGKVLVKPFTIKVKDIELQIGGTHGLDQSIDYIVGLKVPRKYIGTQGNNLINGLVSQANNKGIPVKLGDMVSLNVKMGGSLTNPTIKTDLKEVAGDAVADLKQQAADFAQEKIDSAKARAKDSLNAVKNQVVDNLKDELKNQLFGKDTARKGGVDSAKKKTEQTLKNTLNDLLNKKKKPAPAASDTMK